jgi:hypothetical protein
MGKVAEYLAREKGLSKNQISDAMRDFPLTYGLEHLDEGALDEDFERVMADLPRNAINGEMGGQLSTAERAHDRRVAMDARNTADYLRRFPEAARLFGHSPLESGIPTSTADEIVRHSQQRRKIAMDESWDDFNKRFPGAARIGVV